MTDADKDAVRSSIKGRGGVSAGAVGGSITSAGDPGPLFAPTHPPFDAADVSVSPAGRVWVKRTAPANATATIYDVFDGDGARVERLRFPAGSDVVGFGRGAVYVRETSPHGSTLKKYAA